MRRRTWSLAIGALLLAVVALLSVASIAPPPARGADAPVTEFSAARALAHVEAISRSPHPVGSQAHEEVRAYLLRVLAELGVQARVQESRVALKAAGVTHAALVKNVIARLPGTRPGPAVLLAAHYDSVPGSRGASDDGSGVATLLETARALTASPRMENDVVFLFSDAEEVAACGALAFTRDELAQQPIGVALNFEARGTGGAVALYDTSEANGALVAAVASVVPHVVSSSLLASLARALPNDSDASVFKRAGIPTYAFAYVDRLYQYHQYTDAKDALDPRSLQHDGDYALPLVRDLGTRALPLPPAPAVAYFDVFGRTVVSYSVLTARLLGLLSVVAFLGLAWRAWRTGAVTLRGVALGMGAAVGGLVVAGLASGGVHLVLRALIDPFLLFAHPAVVAGAGALLGVSAVLAAFARPLRSARVTELVLGGLAVWAVALALVAAVAPAASFVLQWPVLGAVAATAVWRRRREQGDARLAWVVSVFLVPAGFFWSSLAYTLFVMVGAQAPEVVALATAAPLLLALPLLAELGAAGVLRLAAAGAVVALVGAVGGGTWVAMRQDVPRPDSLVYYAEPARHLAKWTTTDRRGDSFVAQRIPPGRLSAPAQLYDLAPLETTARAVDEGGERHGTLTVASPRRARCIRVMEVNHEPVLRARVDGREVAEVVRFSAELDERVARVFLGGRAQSSWVMEYCGADESGFKLELFSAPGRPVRLRVIEVSDGFPGPALLPRSSHDGYPDMESDVTMSMVDVTL